MNQILITEKIYVTPEIKRKRMAYKIVFVMSILSIICLSSYYIYAEYDRNKNEEISQEILAGIVDQTTIKRDDGILRVILDERNENNSTEQEAEENEEQENTQLQNTEYVANNGVTYVTESILNIPSLGINYPVLSETSEYLLNISLNKFWGPSPNEVGNYCIVGHNYTNKKMFGKLSEINFGDIVELSIPNGETVNYQVYNKFVVEPDDVSCTSQLTNGQREVTLITCTNHGKQRLVVKAREI